MYTLSKNSFGELYIMRLLYFMILWIVIFLYLVSFMFVSLYSRQAFMIYHCNIISRLSI